MHLRKSVAWAAVGLYGKECPIWGLCEIWPGCYNNAGRPRKAGFWVSDVPAKKLDFIE